MKLSSRTFIPVLAGLMLLPLQAGGQNRPWEEYDKLIDTRSAVGPLDSDLFGDQVNLYNTGLSFSVTDISLPGNNELPVALTRTFSVKSRKSSGHKDLPMATWDLDLPRIEGVFAEASPGWHDNRCNTIVPPTADATGNTVIFVDDNGDEFRTGPGDETLPVEPSAALYGPKDYWHGNHAHMPGSGEMIEPAGDAPVPTMTGDWKWMTSGFTWFSCIDDGVQNHSGQAFLAITADGIKYSFDWMARYYEEKLQGVREPGQTTDPTALKRRRYVLYATKVEDRFGNWVEYHFSNAFNEPAQLDSIEASDGREITLTYSDDRVASASDGTHTWVYQYSAAGDLETVILPDQSRWTIDFSDLWDVEIQYDVSDGVGVSTCDLLTVPLGLWRGGSGTVTHPSGAVGEFEVEAMLHGRHNVPKFCHHLGDDDGTNDVAVWPMNYAMLGLKEKKISGPGLTTMEWTYSGGSFGSWAPNTGPICDTNDPDDPPCDAPVCLDENDACFDNISTTTTVTDPDNNWTRYTFGNNYRHNEGKLLKVEHGTAGSTTSLRTEEMEYELSQPEYGLGTEQDFPIPLGTSLNNRGSVFAATQLAPLKQRTITLGPNPVPSPGMTLGMTFRYIVNEFDQFARPVNVLRQRGSSPDDRREEATAYHDHRGKWILGQIASVTMTGRKRGVDVTVETEETTYSPNLALPLKSERFGKTVQTLSWDYQSTPESGQLGTVWKVTDGRGNETLLSNWKRGIPQSITYVFAGAPDESVSANVNNDGTLDWVIDENGYKTCYDYDGMGRLEKITYPSESDVGVCDTSAWNATTQTFVQVNTGEYGIPKDHWRQTVSTGDGRRITYFDALWRPLLVREYDSTNGTSETNTRRFNAREYDHKGRTTFFGYPSATPPTWSAGIWKIGPDPIPGVQTTYDALGRVTEVLEDSELTGLVKTTTEYPLDYTTLVTDPNGNPTLTYFQGFDEPNYSAPLQMHHPEGAYTNISRDFLGQVDWIMRHDWTGQTNISDLDWNQLRGNNNITISAVRDYVYNSHRELCKIVEPETGATVMAYDGAGNLTWNASGLGSVFTGTAHCNNGDDGGPISVVPVNQRIIRQYDARNRVKTLSFPLADDRGYTTYDYFPDGKLAAISSTSGDIYTRIDYEYNRRRLLTREDPVYRIVNTGIIYYPVVYDYNDNGHQSSKSWPGMPGLNSVDFAPNALGQPTKAGNFAAHALYHPNGALKRFVYGNSILHTLSQNTRGLPHISRDAWGTEKFLHDEYAYDANGNVLAITDGATGENQRGNRDMEYDGLNRLFEVKSPMYGSPPHIGTASYGYDVLDNLRTVSISGGPAPRDHLFHYDENNSWQLTSVTLENCDTGDTQGNLIWSDRFQGGCHSTPETNFYYDTRGNLSQRNITTYDFDHGNRLRQVTELRTSQYEYDGHGRRVSDSISGIGGGSRYSYYTADGRLSYAMDDRRGVLSLYIYLGGRLVAVRERDANQVETTRYQHTDALGSPLVETGEYPEVVTRYQYEPYGQVHDRIPYATPPDGPGYTGHLFDDVTGLNYMQQRYYDPGVGRFISTDPVGADRETGGNFNRYWYAANNPYKYVDPDGREIRCAGTTCTFSPTGSGLTVGPYPRPDGHPGLIDSSTRFQHEYRFETHAGRGDASYGQRLENELVKSGTPIPGKAATTEGTLIDVNANNDISSFTGKDHVMSYLIDLGGGKNAVLNVTQGDHAGKWGAVLRVVESGPAGSQKIVTYGEGNSKGQWIFDPENKQARDVWRRNSEEIIERAR